MKKETEYKRCVGKKIRAVREIVGMSQTEFALALGYSSNAAISLIESGLRGMADERLRMIEDKFDVPHVALISDIPMDKCDVRALQNLTRIIKAKAAGKPSDYYKAIQTMLEAAASAGG